jgi:hypothetical protein
MALWGPIRPIMVGGLLAVGFLDEHRVIVGSHDGLGVFEASSGVRLDRVRDPDGDYGRYRESPPSACTPTPTAIIEFRSRGYGAAISQTPRRTGGHAGVCLPEQAWSVPRAPRSRSLTTKNSERVSSLLNGRCCRD